MAPTVLHNTSLESIPGPKSSLESIKKQISMLELSLTGKTGEALANKLFENVKISSLLTKSANCIDFMSSVQQENEKTQLEEVIQSCFEKVLTKKAGKIIARRFADSSPFATEKTSTLTPKKKKISRVKNGITFLFRFTNVLCDFNFHSVDILGVSGVRVKVKYQSLYSQKKL